MTKKENAHYRKDPNFVTRRIAGETILVPVKVNTKTQNSLFTLNEVATEIWERIDGRRSLAAIREEICSLFDAEEGRVKKDTERLFETLLEIGAIQEVN